MHCTQHAWVVLAVEMSIAHCFGESGSYKAAIGIVEVLPLPTMLVRHNTMPQRLKGDLRAQDIPAAAESAGQAAAAVDGVFHVLSAGEEAEQEEKDQTGGKTWVSAAATAN